MIKKNIFQKAICRFASYGIFNKMADKPYLKMMYWARTGKRLNLSNPHTFNEKIQWMKLNYRRFDLSKMVDKYETKEYVSSIIGKEYIIPTLGIWNHFDEIDFDQLPNQFVLKCTHDSGGLIICRDKTKLDKIAAKKKIEKSLSVNYFLHGREWPYKNVKPRIIAEKFMVDESDEELKDYKVFNFNGVPRLIQVDFDRFKGHKRNLYSIDWEYLDASIEFPNDINVKIAKPKKLEEMLSLAAKLSEDFPHVRTDFYSIGDKIYFGELTFYHGSGFEDFKPIEFEKKIGQYFKLPLKITGGQVDDR